MRAGPGISRGGNRVHLTEENREVLVKLCVARRMEFSYKKGTKAPFWGKIRALLRAEIDKDLKNPDTTMRQLVNERRAVVAVQKKESGTAQTDTELDQNLDHWIERENELLREQEDVKKPKEVLQKEALQAAIHRDNLLVSHSRKRYYSSSSSDNGSDCTEVMLPTAEGSSYNGLGSDHHGGTLAMPDSQEQTEEAIQKVRHMRKKTRHEDYRKKDQQINSQLIDALTGMGQKVSDALGKLGSSEGTSVGMEAAEAMSNRIDRLEETMKATNGETKDMLQLILSRLGTS